MGPLGILAILTALKAAGSAANYAFNKPQKPHFPMQDIMRENEVANMRNANEATANAGLALGPQLRSRGLQDSGLGSYLMSRMATQNAASGLRDLSQSRIGLLGQKAQMENEYQQQKQQRLADLLSGLTGAAEGGAGAYAGMSEEERQNKMLMDLLMKLYGGGGAEGKGGAWGGSLYPSQGAY